MREGSGWPGGGPRSACTGSGCSVGEGRSSGTWNAGAGGSGRSFTAAKADSGRSWRKTPAGCWGAGENALRGSVGDRARGGRSLPKRHGRVGGTGRGGGEDGWLGRPCSLRSPYRSLETPKLRGAGAAGAGAGDLGRSMESRLTRSGSGPGRGQASLWCPRGFRRTIGRSVVCRNAEDRSGTRAPAAERHPF